MDLSSIVYTFIDIIYDIHVYVEIFLPLPLYSLINLHKFYLDLLTIFTQNHNVSLFPKLLQRFLTGIIKIQRTKPNCERFFLLQLHTELFALKQNGENFFFLVQMFYNPMGYLACIMF